MRSGVLRIFIFFFYLLFLPQLACSQRESRLSPEVSQVEIRYAPTAGEQAETEAVARRFRLSHYVLQQVRSEDLRVDAAVELLLQNRIKSRDVLLSALKSEENTNIRQAVCKALIRSRNQNQKIDSLEEFRAPLLAILKSEVAEEAKLAAEAMLLFDYSVIASSLDAIIQNNELSLSIRLNAVYALQLRSEPAALRRLIQLLDDPDAEIAKAAEAALQEAFDIPAGADRAEWLKIRDELQLKSREDIQTEQLLQKGKKLPQVEAERDRWQKLYLAALDKQYESLDEAGRGGMISDMMGSELPAIRLWALDKASKYTAIGDDHREKILLLLGDSSRDVRLQTAKALMNMSALNPAAVLLERLKVEEDDEVRLAMFEALGEACFFAFSPGSPIKLSEDIKIETLEIASEYLQSASEADCIKGAEVIRKILELNNLSEKTMQSYLGLLNKRYAQSIDQNESIRAELLAILAHLCGQGGAKEAACAFFGPLFMDAMAVENAPALRLAAVQGLSYVDKVQALELFKQNNLMQDPSLAVQQVVVDVAGQTGDATDLEWLLASLGDNSHGDRVWLAIRSICQRQDAVFLLDWLLKLESVGATKDEYVREILDIAEQKAIGEKEQEVLKRVREQTIFWLSERKAWEQGVAYLSGIDYLPSENLYSDQTGFEAFNICLYGGAAEKAAQYVEFRLSESDIKQDSPLVAAINGYFSDKDIEGASEIFLEKISSISKDGRPNWSAFMDSLERQLSPSVSQEPAVSDGDADE